MKLCVALLGLLFVTPAFAQTDAEQPNVPRPEAGDIVVRDGDDAVPAVVVIQGPVAPADPAVAPEGAEGEEAAATAETPAQPELDELLRQMGAPPEAAMFLKMLAQQDMDPMTMFLLMAMMDGGNIDGDFMGFLLFSKMMQQGAKGAPPPPPTMLHGNQLIIVDDGTIYLLDADTLKLTAKLEYKPKAEKADPLTTILPMLMGARGAAAAKEAKARAEAMAAADAERKIRAMQTAAQRAPEGCEGNLRRLCRAALQYAADNQNTLPGVDWPVTLAAYVGHAGAYQCPARPQLPVAFAINEAAAGIKLTEIRDPAKTVLFFESDLGTDLPIGGPEALVENARHEGKVGVGFVAGHTAMVTLEEARALLAGEAVAEEAGATAGR